MVQVIKFYLNLDMSVGFKLREILIFWSLIRLICGILNRSHKFFLMVVSSLSL